MLDFLYIAVSWVLLRWHDLFTALGFSDASGWGWTLSIIFLVVTARVLLFRLFLKQVHYTRNMQKLQPKMAKLREKYKDDRAELNRQMMALQQEEGFNPLSGCLPMLLQFPVFIGLFHVLRHLSNSVGFCAGGLPLSLGAGAGHINKAQSDLLGIYTFSPSETCHAASAKIFDAPLAASFNEPSSRISQLGGDVASTRWVLILLLLVSAAATLGTQLLARANATTVPEGTAATIQRLMLWVIPLGVLASGLLFHFPLGVLLYWFTSNLWTLGQQAYIIRYHPPEETKAEPVGVVGKTLAPAPGQKPVRTKPSAQAGSPVSTTKSAPPPTGSGGTSNGRAQGPGKSPTTANRPAGKRPTKKRR